MTTPDHAPLSPEIAEKLLHLLSTDDAFRESFSRDAPAALEKLGHPLPGTATPMCLKVEKLASKEEFKQAREQLLDHLTSIAGLTVIFCYEAGRIKEAVVR